MAAPSLSAPGCHVLSMLSASAQLELKGASYNQPISPEATTALQKSVSGYHWSVLRFCGSVVLWPWNRRTAEPRWQPKPDTNFHYPLLRCEEPGCALVPLSSLLEPGPAGDPAGVRGSGVSRAPASICAAGVGGAPAADSCGIDRGVSADQHCTASAGLAD